MEGITEQKYLEVCEDFKNMILQKDREVNIVKTNIKILGKIVAESYGVVKLGVSIIYTSFEKSKVISHGILHWVLGVLEGSRDLQYIYI